jgi:hypothetical protein
VSDIAAGKVENAAKKVEQTMANTLPLVIAFLAKLVGLGSIPEKLVGIVKKIRQPIDRAMDKIVAWLGKMLQKMVGAAKAGAEALLQWWKNRVGFTNADGETHTLLFQGEQESSVLAIESRGRPLAIYLAEYEKTKNPDAEQKNIIKQIRTKVTKIENIKTKYGTRRHSAFGPKEGEEIRVLFTEISQLLAKLSGEKVPETDVKWGKKGEDGKSMIAKPLTINPGENAGSQPAEESKLWNKVKTIFPGKYVRGHLLNHHVHGPGVKKNLTPITIGANNKMRSKAENQVKKAVLEEKRILRYEVKVNTYHTETADFPETENLPQKIEMLAVEIKRKDGGWKDVNQLFKESVESPLPEK